nr:cathepsin L1-like [Halyomorpha halys]
MRILLLLASFFIVSSAAPAIDELWSMFKEQHGKTYRTPLEEFHRISIFTKNLNMIEQHNAKYGAGMVSYKMKLNRFADMLPEEVSAQLNGFNKTGQLINHKRTGLKFLAPANVEIPESVDWREEGAVTPIKDQGTCGGCWAFSTTGAIEAQLFRQTKKLVSLSEQQLIDCSSEYGNQGCDGGLMDNAFEYIQDNGGVASEESYPYQGEVGHCKSKKLNPVHGTSVRTHVNLPEGSERALQEAVATVGPVSVAVSASNSGFLHYGGGIFDGDSCEPEELDHGVLVVGYGSEEGQDYWIIKNSWSTRWGEQGYMRLARNKGNICGVAYMASYPLL